MGAGLEGALSALSYVTERLIALCGQNGPAIAFLAAFVESLIGLGALLPGGTVVVLAGFAVRDQGPVALLAVTAMAWLGMTAGSALDYWLGCVAGRRLVPRNAPWRLATRWRKALRTSRRFMHRWGWWAIFAANLAGPGRSSIAVASGASGWSFRQFMAAQATSAAIWSAAFAGIGYFAAGEAERLEVVVSGAGAAMLLVFAVLFGAQLVVGAVLKVAFKRLRPRALPVSAS